MSLCYPLPTGLQCPVTVPEQTLLTRSQTDDMWKCLLVVGDSWLPFNPDDFTKWVKMLLRRSGFKRSMSGTANSDESNYQLEGFACQASSVLSLWIVLSWKVRNIWTRGTTNPNAGTVIYSFKMISIWMTSNTSTLSFCKYTAELENMSFPEETVSCRKPYNQHFGSGFTSSATPVLHLQIPLVYTSRTEPLFIYRG